MLSDKLRDLMKDIGWTTFGIASALGIDYFFYLITGRLLGPETFGLFGVFMSIYYITVRAPFSAIEITSRKIEVDGHSAFEQLGDKALVLGLIILILFLASSGPVTNILGLPLETFLIFSFILPLAYITSVITGIFQGRQRFNKYAIYEITSSLAKFSAVSLILVGLGLKGAIMAPVLEIWAGFAVLYYFLKPKINFGKFNYSKTLLKSALYVIAINMAFSLDILLLKVFKPAETVGLYNSVAVLGKAVFFSSVAISKTVFPKFGSSRKDLWILKISLLLLALEGIAAVLFFSAMGDIFLWYTFGQEYTSAAIYAPVYMIFITLVGATGILGNYMLSTDKRGLYLILLMPTAQFTLIMMFHNTVLEVISAGIAGSSITLALMILNAYLDRTRG